ncbi:MAG: AbrB/MazE/SpoVT family DNA-binding domain-containing protein [Planctomycetota bacterium]|nr:AbrB/MazE/SpoVT family DNA-binding domain-containing protein [Planctomycetota bacterium]
MVTRVQQWGNSLAVRIPRAMALDVALQAGKPVDVSVRSGSIVIKPAHPRRYRLDDLLKGVTRANRHGEVSTGHAVGKEL